MSAINIFLLFYSKPKRCLHLLDRLEKNASELWSKNNRDLNDQLLAINLERQFNTPATNFFMTCWREKRFSRLLDNQSRNRKM